jgi:hypothetical protein
MAEEKFGLKELLINCVLITDFRHSFMKDPEGFLKDNPQYVLSEEDKTQLKAFKVADWDSMKLSELNDWLVQAGEISRPGGVTISIP